MASPQVTPVLPGSGARKKLFLVDAMAHVYRAFFAPMNRMNAPSGVPSKVPFLFNNILRRLLKDYQPEYVGIVFDTSKPTFRDKLFEKYKAKRQPMPDELALQLPYVRRLCEAMRLPILEFDGFEADDVLGCLRDTIPNLSRSALHRCHRQPTSSLARRRYERMHAMQ